MAIINIPNFEYELEYLSRGYRYIAGIDEVGRGAWAGPVVAAAVILPLAPQDKNVNIKDKKLDGINDSKLLTVKKREYLAEIIIKIAFEYSFGMATVNEINNLGLSSALYIAYQRAIKNILKVDFVLIDGYGWPKCHLPNKSIIKGDQISISIAAASIIAKVERDKIMRILHRKEEPRYRFDLHKGYGTKLHQERLAKYGISQYHRVGFKPIKNAGE